MPLQRMKALAVALAMLLLLLPTRDNPAIKATPVCAPKSVSACSRIQPSKPEFEQSASQWATEELQAMALTLAGECYDDKELDKRRVSSDQFDDSIIEVLTAKNQFSGYWVQSRAVTENDLAVAEQALRDWYNNGCEPLSEYLFFCAGENRENNFW